MSRWDSSCWPTWSLTDRQEASSGEWTLALLERTCRSYEASRHFRPVSQDPDSSLVVATLTTFRKHELMPLRVWDSYPWSLFFSFFFFFLDESLGTRLERYGHEVMETWEWGSGNLGMGFWKPGNEVLKAWNWDCVWDLEMTTYLQRGIYSYRSLGIGSRRMNLWRLGNEATEDNGLLGMKLQL